MSEIEKKEIEHSNKFLEKYGKKNALLYNYTIKI